MAINYYNHNISTSGSITAVSGNFSQNLLINGSGISLGGHSHTSSDITNFNTSVSGLLPTIANSGDNRVLTSTGSTLGINAESNLTFNGATLSVTGNVTISKSDGIPLNLTSLENPSVDKTAISIYGQHPGFLKLAI